MATSRVYSRFLKESTLALRPLISPLGFGFDGGGTVLVSGSKIRRVITSPCHIVGWRLIGDQTGSITLDIKKATPSGQTLNFTSIVAAAAPSLSNQVVANNTTLTGWTKILQVGDVLEVSISSVSDLNTIALTLEIR